MKHVFVDLVDIGSGEYDECAFNVAIFETPLHPLEATVFGSILQAWVEEMVAWTFLLFVLEKWGSPSTADSGYLYPSL